MEQQQQQEWQEEEDERPSPQRRRRPQHLLHGAAPPMPPEPHPRRRGRCARRRTSRLHVRGTPRRRNAAAEPPSLLDERAGFASPVPSVAAATPPSDNRSGQKRLIAAVGRGRLGGGRRQVLRGASPSPRDDDDGDDDDDDSFSYGGRDDGILGWGTCDDEWSVSLQSFSSSPGAGELSSLTSFSPGTGAGGGSPYERGLGSTASFGGGRSEWTLQSFADHEERQLARQHSRAKREGPRRQLSLASAHSNGPVRETEGAAAKAKRAAGGPGKAVEVEPHRRSRVESSLVATRLFFKLVLICFALLALGGTLLIAPYADRYMTSLTGLDDSPSSTESGSDGEDRAGAGGHFHPLFQHGERTADVEVEVPAEPVVPPRKKDARAPPAESDEGGGSGQQGSSAARRRARASPPGSGDDGRPDPDGRDRRKTQSAGFADIVQGSTVQELCPATHTLLSQSLILRSSYGNIFSITTPERMVGRRKRNFFGEGVEEQRRDGAARGQGPRGGGSLSATRTGRGKRNGGGGLDDGWGERPDVRDKRGGRDLQQQQQRQGGGNLFQPRQDRQNDAGNPNDAAGNDHASENEPGAEGNALASSSPTTSGPTLSPVAEPTTGAPSPNPTDDNSNNQYQGDYSQIDTASESIYTGAGVETITVQTLSLRMADFKPDEDTHFEVWLYTGSGDDVQLNENDLDDDPSNDNVVIPSRAEYQSSRAKFTDWVLISEGLERDLVPDRDFFDHNGHVFNIGAGTPVGPLGTLENYENMEDATVAAREWNRENLREDGGMDAITAEGEVTTTYYYKIPEEKFIPLKLPKYNGKLTLFVTLDRVGLQYGYAAKQEFDNVDVNKHDYIDQTPSLDVLNGNVDLRMHVGEGVIFYPWMEEEFFYQTRRFLGKVWYEARIPCEYVPVTEVLDIPEVTTRPSTATSDAPSVTPTTDPTMAPTMNGTNVTIEVMVSVLIKRGDLPPMPDDVQEVFEETLLEFVKDSFAEFCPITWNEGANVADQELTPVGALPGTGGATAASQGRRHRYIDFDNPAHHVSERKKDTSPRGEGRGRWYLRRLLAPIFRPSRGARSRLLNTITVLDVTTVIDALYSTNACPGKTPEELAKLIEAFVNANDDEFVDLLKAAHDYFRDAFGVSADIIDSDTVVVMSAVEEEGKNTGGIIGGIMAAIILCCFCCCLPLLVLRRRKRRKERENEIIGEDIEWARPVDEDHFPPLGGYRADDGTSQGDLTEDDAASRTSRKRPDGELSRENESHPSVELKPVPQGIRPPSEDSELLHDHRYLDREDSDAAKKKRPFGAPGRMRPDEDGADPYNIDIYPGGDYVESVEDPDDINMRRVRKSTREKVEGDWSPEHYEPDGGVHSYSRPKKSSPDINPNWSRLNKKGESRATPKEKLSIKQLVLQRKRDLEAKKAAMRHVERVEAGLSDDEEETQTIPKAEPDSRIEDLMGRIKDLESDRQVKYQRPQRFEEESDYERWKRLNVEEEEISSSEESSVEEIKLRAAKKKKKKKKKKEGKDYVLNFDDLDAYNRALAVHQDAFIHKWVKVKVEKGEEDDGAALDDVEMESGADGDTGLGGMDSVSELGGGGDADGTEGYGSSTAEDAAPLGDGASLDSDYDTLEGDDEIAAMDEELARMDEELARMDEEIAQMDKDGAGDG